MATATYAAPTEGRRMKMNSPSKSNNRSRKCKKEPGDGTCSPTHRPEPKSRFDPAKKQANWREGRCRGVSLALPTDPCLRVGIDPPGSAPDNRRVKA
ncbi:hypothetical protein NDU88_005465 [Pleurodeles waltl]|uniref:Uncharacterized protein n=1 Tax=Pleurodeles waltl TaxID=8319 RepID=A0AAV7LP90_PLEWA|nr:hypothetical protein NDU88_005465 [Pleurodeles waltl]